MRPLGVAHLTALNLAQFELVREAARAGFAAVGLRLHPVMPGARAYPLKSGSLAARELKAVIAGEGVRVSDIEFVSLKPAFQLTDYEGLLAAGADLGASSLTVSGDDLDHARLVHNFAALCELAGGYGMRVDLEFMRWRPVATLQQAVAVVTAARQGNAGVLLDALHLYRSGGDENAVAQVDPHYLRAVQVCDAPLQAPEETLIIQEAREGRLMPGRGQLPLEALLSALPADVQVSVETPSALFAPELCLKAAYEATRSMLAAA